MSASVVISKSWHKPVICVALKSPYPENTENIELTIWFALQYLRLNLEVNIDAQLH